VNSACQLDVRVLGHGCLPFRSAWITRSIPSCTIAPAVRPGITLNAGSWGSTAARTAAM
jgi:hypothetical protein